MSAREALHSSQSVEWFTPPDVTTAVRELMGYIGLDPASCPLANEVVQARKFYTETDDGLVQSWDDYWFCNPPYGDGKTQEWVNKGTESDFPGVMLVNATPDRRWFKKLWNYPICFPERRIHFLESVEQRHARIAIQLAKKHGGEPWDFANRVPPYNGPTYADGRLVVGPQPTHGNAIVFVSEGAFPENSILSAFGHLGHIAWPRR